MTQHICSKDEIIESLKNQTWELKAEHLATDTTIVAIKEDVRRVENDMVDMRKEIQEGFRGVSNKIIAAMGFIISILLTALGVLIYDSFK